MHSLQKMSFSVLLCGVLVASSILFVPTDSLGALPKKKLEIIIGGDNFCKDDKDCAGDSFCNMTSHICIICPKPFEWVGGTQCVCPSGSVPNADNTDCVECMTAPDCQDLKGNLHWVCDTGTNTCACMSGLHEESGECVCDNPNKTADEDGNCICQLSQSDCPTSDFTGTNDCKCCPAETPKWDGLECRTCADVNRTKPYYNPSSHTCVECLTDAHCENEEVCSADKKCVCEMTQGDCSISDFNADVCLCCPASIPVYDSTSGTCKTCADIDDTKPYYNSDTKTCEVCPEPTPFWNNTTKVCECPISYGAIHGLGDGTRACWPYCEKQDVGLLLFVDRSSSTKGTYEKYINSALASITVPDVYKVAAFLDHGAGQNTKVTTILPYDFYTNEQIQSVVQSYSLRGTPAGTSFVGALTYVRDYVCTGEERFLMVMWTDADLTGNNNALIGAIKTKCPNSKFYYVSPSNNMSNANRWFNIKKLASDEEEAEAYATFLQDEIKQEGCVPRPEEIIE